MHDELSRLDIANRELQQELDAARRTAEAARSACAAAQDEQATAVNHALRADQRAVSLAVALENERGRADRAEALAHALELELRKARRSALDNDRLAAELRAVEGRAIRERQQAELNVRLLYEEQEARARADAERERLAHRVLQLDDDVARLARAATAASAYPAAWATPAQGVPYFAGPDVSLPLNPFA
ncbi:hypothetical protein KFE25_012462 [Diacronema lutheri]|uniref:Uncharacterized protein n=1 Tax=Diacronema lutheri TaxID=2081491 RepID=A0A8J6CA15_DIALT|nr:hypothetical protein KFE25_012462 [Diacronema lutheri]